MEYPKKDGDNLKAQQDMDSIRNVFEACVDENRASAEIFGNKINKKKLLETSLK